MRVTNTLLFFILFNLVNFYDCNLKSEASIIDLPDLPTFQHGDAWEAYEGKFAGWNAQEILPGLDRHTEVIVGFRSHHAYVWVDGYRLDGQSGGVREIKRDEVLWKGALVVISNIPRWKVERMRDKLQNGWNCRGLSCQHVAMKFLEEHGIGLREFRFFRAPHEIAFSAFRDGFIDRDYNGVSSEVYAPAGSDIYEDSVERLRRVLVVESLNEVRKYVKSLPAPWSLVIKGREERIAKAVHGKLCRVLLARL